VIASATLVAAGAGTELLPDLVNGTKVAAVSLDGETALGGGWLMCCSSPKATMSRSSTRTPRA